MIIGVWSPLQLGRVERGPYEYREGELIPAAFFVIRTATYEEWLEYRRSEGRELHVSGEEAGFFYEVSTD